MRRSAGADNKPRKSSKTGSLAQYGLFDIPGVDFNPDNDFGGHDDDDDLEAELNMIISTGPSRPPPSPKPKPKVPTVNLDAMVAASLRDDPGLSDESGGEDDPELMAELDDFMGDGVGNSLSSMDPTPVIIPTSAVVNASTENSGQAIDMLTIIRERTALYLQAEAAAIENNDNMKARRLKRGLDQLKVLLKRAESGGLVNEDEIPLTVSVNAAKKLPEVNQTSDYSESTGDTAAPPSSANDGDQSSPSSSAPTIDPALLQILTERRDEYKKAAVIAKRAGDINTALAHVRVIKQFDAVIEAAEKGQTVDLSTMPPSPDSLGTSNSADKASSGLSQSSDAAASVKPLAPEPPQEEAAEEVPLTVMGALESRLAKFKEQEESAKAEGNASKQRRMGRIVKQYQDAIRAHAAGRPIPVDELPTPPGFPPIPVADSDAVKSDPADNSSAPGGGGAPASISGTSSAVTDPSPTPSVPSAQPPLPPRASAAPPAPPPQSLRGKETRNERQLAVLLLKQKEFRQAALKAKEAGDLVKAKEYLRQSKAFDAVIDASRSGLPVDMDTLPRGPSKSSSSDSFEVVRIADCLPGSDSEVFDQLLNDLQKQMKMCIETRNHFKAIGDVASANRFDHLAAETKKEFETVKAAKIQDKPIPAFHYEKRPFSIVRCNIDLNDNDLELSILQGINYNVPNPKEVDTYVKFEFPYPNDESKKDKTTTIYNTNNPEYKATFLIPIQRNSRSFQRLFKRHSIKMELWSKGGFLRSDSLLGTVQVKLQPLETKCTIHDAFVVMEGRRPLGGKIEVKVRVRNPIVTKQIEQIEEKWLVIA